MVTLQELMTLLETASKDYETLAGTLRELAGREVEARNYETAQTAIEIAEFYETCIDAFGKLKEAIAEIG
jgi:hypothetical protein